LGLTQAARQAIDALQPFHGPNRRTRPAHDLANLQRLSNWDKHRQLVIGGINTAMMSWYGDGRPVAHNPGHLANGAIYTEFPPGAEVSANPDLACQVVFIEPATLWGAAPDLTLGNIHDYIRDTVIPAMRPHC
jgi:hypothetical protein